MHTCSRQPGGRSRGDLRLTGLAAVSGPAGRWQAQKKWTGCSQKPRRARRGLGCLRSTSAPTRAPPLATFWAPTHPQTRLQAPTEPPVHAGSGGARGGRRWSRCCCVFAHVAAAACRARTHGSPGHNFSTAIAVSEVLKPLRAPLARGFWAENMTPQPLQAGFRKREKLL